MKKIYIVESHYPEPDKEDEFNKRAAKSWVEFITKKLPPEVIEKLKQV